MRRVTASLIWLENVVEYMNIPFNKICVTGNELKYVMDAVRRGKIGSGGYYTDKVTNLIKKQFGTRRAFFTSSCSAALDASALIIGLEKDDEVIMPSFTFTSTANAVLLRGARPVFVDIDDITFNMNTDKIEEKLTSKTKAIYPVHYGGVSCSMEDVSSIASKKGLKVVEDAAQAFGATYRGEYLGTIGNIGCFSFHETKNISCGEGGCLLINDSALEWDAEIVVEKGTNRTKFLNGEVDKYTWVSLGSSYLGSEISAAYLLAQVENMKYINGRRKEVASNYLKKIMSSKIFDNNKIRISGVPFDNTCNYHAYPILVEDEKTRKNVIVKMKEKGISVASHYVPLHLSPMGKSLGYKEGDFPVTEYVASRILRLPIYPGLSENDVERIVNELEKCLE